MSLVYFGADLHLGHKNIAKYRSKEFSTAEYHDEYILDMVSSFINKRSVIYLLGDVCFTVEAIQKLARLNTGKNIRIILGNHDTERTSISDWVNAGFDKIHGLVKYKEFWLSHAPVHDSELRGKSNIHGHNHSNIVPDSRYRCVSLEQTNYKLISLGEIRNEFAAATKLKQIANTAHINMTDSEKQKMLNGENYTYRVK